MDTVANGSVTGGPATHQHTQAAEVRVVQLLYGGLECSQVDVDDVA